MASKDAFLWHPTWPISTWARKGVGSSNDVPTATGIDAGVTFVTSPAHPWASTDGEVWLKFAGDAAHHFPLVRQFIANDGVSATPPDNTLRWGERLAFLWRHGTSAGVGDDNPSAQQIVIDGRSGSPTFPALLYNTDRTWTILGPASSFTATSAAATATLTDYLIEIWCVHNYSNGTDRGATNYQWVVRAMTPTGGSVTTLIDTTNSAESGVGLQVSTANAYIILGDGGSSGGANFHYFIGSPATSWEDADNPAILRGSQMVPNSTTSVVFDEFPGNAADVDESGTAVPSNAGTDYDVAAMGVAPNDIKRQFYQLTTPNYPASGDSIRSVVEATWFSTFDPGKSGQQRWSHGISDGTNTVFLQVFAAGAISTMALNIWNKNPAVSAWAFGDLAGLQGGVKAVTTIPSGTGNFFIYTMTMTVVYANQTDTFTAVPGTGSPTTRRIFVC